MDALVFDIGRPFLATGFSPTGQAPVITARYGFDTEAHIA
jgi:hypothetical protein